MNNRKAITARRHLIQRWDEVTNTLMKLNSNAQVKPEIGESVFADSNNSMNGVVSFDLKPVVFNLPERADDVAVDLFIVVEGRLDISEDSVGNSQMLTHNFSTKAAYFRKTREELVHVYGAHYDFALNELGHPTFHMQLKSFSGLVSHVTQNYRINHELVDGFAKVLRNVRLPCAQMDFFSFFTQICADHLLFEKSGIEERKAFNDLVKKGTFLKGAGFRSSRLIDDAAHSCYRAGHWYPLLP